MADHILSGPARDQLVEALELALTGLKWYRDSFPDAADGSDDEADATIAAAVALLQSLPDPEATTARAFEIADEAMNEWLHSYGVTGLADPDCIGFCADGQGEVDTLAEAGEELREAVEWLQPRGYVAVETDPDGREFVRVLRELTD